MRLLLSSRYVVGLMISIVTTYCFFDSISNSNQVLLDDLILSVSGTTISVALCKVFSNEISQNCIHMNEGSKNNFIKYVHQAKKSLRPGHSNVINMYLIKIAFTSEVEKTEKTNCFLVDELEGEKDLYFSKIDSGKNCSNNSFKYLEGSVKVTNFLKFNK